MAGSTDRRRTPPPAIHRGPGMKARLPEAAGGRPGPAGRSGPASFPGPSSRTKAGDAAGAGTPVSGALGAALAASLLAAALLLAPGGAWGQCVGLSTTTNSDVTCNGATYSLSIRSVVDSNASLTIRVPGGTGTGGTATVITAGSFYPGIAVDANNNSQTGNYAIYVGASGPVSIVDETSGSGNASRGIRILQYGSGTATVEVGSQVTIGASSSARMREHGIYVRGSGSAGAVTITNAGTIYATYEGIDVKNDGPATMTLTHSGTVDSLNHGILAWADGTGPLFVTNSGDVTVTNTGQQGIRMEAGNNGAAMTLTATGGTITAPAQGIYMESRGTGAVTLRGTDADAETQTGPTIMGGTHGIEVYKSGSSATAGDVSITTTGGSITGNGGNGIRATYQTYASGNGGISVTVGAGASVTGSTAGVYVANGGSGLMVARKYTPGYGVGIAPDEDPGNPDELVAAMHGEGGSAVALRNQLVTVRGTVTGGTGAAVYLLDGGAVLVPEGGRVHAGSGDAILATGGPALVYIDGEVRGTDGGDSAVYLASGGSVTVGPNGRVRANGASYAIRGAPGAEVMVTLVVPDLYRDTAPGAIARVEGRYGDAGDGVRFREDRNGVPTGYFATLEFGPDGQPDPSGLALRPEPGSGPGPGGPAFSFFCDEAGDGRCRMYEALPSMLVALNALPSWAQRSSAPRDANGAWASVEASRGEWRAKKATATGPLAYDHRWVVGRMGVDFTPREDLRVGWSVHVPRGKAEMAGVGEVELDGVGAGVSATWRSGDFYVDAQAAVTRYDVGFESNMHGELLNEDVSGVGYALGVEGGKRMPVGEAFVTPRAGLAWSDVDLDDFTDMETAGAPERRSRVSVQDAGSVKGRVGVTVEKEMGMGAVPGLLFGSLDVERELSDETEVKVGEERLKTEVRPAAVSLGAGAVFDVREDVLLRAVAGYRTSGGGTSGYRGGLELQVRF